MVAAIIIILVVLTFLGMAILPMVEDYKEENDL